MRIPQFLPAAKNSAFFFPVEQRRSSSRETEGSEIQKNEQDGTAQTNGLPHRQPRRTNKMISSRSSP